MAERRQVEADLLARDMGPDDPAVQKKRRMAQELRDAADETESKARDLRGQVCTGWCSRTVGECDGENSKLETQN
jgi:hypothetical protein